VTAAPRGYAVIGSGVVGAALAGALAARGAPVTLLDRDRPGRATTRSSLAWCNANEKTPRAYYDRNLAGMRAWAALASTMDGENWFRPVGNLEWSADPGALTERVRRLADWGYAARMIDPVTAAALEPGITLPPGNPALAWFPEEAYLLTEPLVDRLVARAEGFGASVRTGDAGRVVDVTEGEVRTASGPAVTAGVVVCCAGRWTPELAGRFGPPVPLLRWDEPGSEAPCLIVRVGPVAEPVPRRLLHTPEVVLRPHPDGLLHLEAEDARVDLHTPERDLRGWAAELLDRARRIVPGLAGARVVEHRVCVRPIPVDWHPIVGPVGDRGYVVVTHSGVTLGAHLAELVATELTEGRDVPELAPYRPTRFDSTASLGS
jgi:glycine/D-amino acid oxidase-like deaminating enzyme